MSGIEAAGLIVGAIPIIIWGLENYKVARNIWYRSRNKALLVDRLINALREQQVLIEIDLRILSRAAGCEDDEMEFLEGSSCYDFLQDQRLERPFAQYLGRAYEPYQNALGRCERILTDLAQSIGGIMPQIPSPNACESYLVELINIHAGPTAPSRWRQTSQKIKFALKKEELERKISELDASTSMLSRLRVAGGALQDDDQQMSSSRTIAKLSHFLSKILFRIESLPLSASAELKVWYSAHVEALADEEEEEEQTESVEEREHPSRSHNVPTVAFNLLRLDPLRKAQVQDLCAILTGTLSSDEPLKLYLSERGSLSACYQLSESQTQDHMSHSPAGTVSLESIIQRAYDSREYSMRWSLNQRMLLAYRLASSLLQFHSTLWLRGSWDKRSICFSHNGPLNTSDSEAFTFDADSPFIIHDFQSTPVPDAGDQSNAKAPLLDLGILLLEIWHLKPFETYAAQEKLHVDNTYGVRFEAASRWLKDTAENVLPFYWDPTCRCIQGTFTSNGPTLQWDDRQLQASICEGLIKPLWDNCVGKAR
ncbi:MAG: hypothetical protein Q9172_006889 [Xanthocarpia lactea]